MAGREMNRPSSGTNGVIVMASASPLETELIEIDENVCRAELTPAQRAVP